MKKSRIGARWLALAALSPVLSLPAAAEEPAVDNLIYSVNRTPEPTFNTARAAEVITAEDIKRKNVRTLPELLMEEVGVFVQQTNDGGGSPIIRGLVGKQILILVDGVRMNNSTYRFGPIQYLATIDLAAVERVEIVRGVGSVLGSDALGGTINIIMKRGPSSEQKRGVHGTLFTRYSTADTALTGRAEVSGSSEKMRYLGGLTYRESGVLKGGGAIGPQIGTGYDEVAGNFNFDYFLSGEKTLSLSYMGLEQSDVPRTDRIRDRTNRVYEFEPQRNQLASVSFEDLTSRSWVDFVRITAYWNRQEEGKTEIRNSALTNEIRQFDGVGTLGANLEFSKFLGRHQVLWGLDYSRDSIESTRVDTNLATADAQRKRGSYTDGSSYDLLAFYLQDRLDLTKWLNLKVGGRYSRFSANGSEVSSVGTLDLNSSHGGLTGAANLVARATKNLNLVAGVTRGFRAPNIEDLSVFDQRSEGTEVPNTDLAPEWITSYEIGAKYSSGPVSGSAFYYQSYLSDLLVRGPGTFNGLPYFDLNGNGVRDANEPLVLQKRNVGKGEIKGFELKGSYRPHRAVTVFGNFTSTKGDDVTDGVPMARIPPSFGTLGVRWKGREGHRPWGEVVYNFAAAQTRLNPSDVTDSRIGPNGTDGFNVFHVRGGISFGDSLDVTLAVENVTDEAYKYHGSGIFRPGRQLVVGVTYRATE